MLVNAWILYMFYEWKFEAGRDKYGYLKMRIL